MFFSNPQINNLRKYKNSFDAISQEVCWTSHCKPAEVLWLELLILGIWGREDVKKMQEKRRGGFEAYLALKTVLEISSWTIYWTCFNACLWLLCCFCFCFLRVILWDDRKYLMGLCWQVKLYLVFCLFNVSRQKGRKTGRKKGWS